MRKRLRFAAVVALLTLLLAPAPALARSDQARRPRCLR